MSTAFRTIGLSLLALAAAVAGAATAGEEVVRLTMQERLGLERRAEPVTIGVPLPRGMIKSADELALAAADGNKPIPADIRPVVKWQDGSVRWVHLSFLGDCPASGQAGLSLLRGASPSPAAKLSVDDGAEAITVDTGVVKFVVRKKGFNLIDQAWVGGEQVIATHERGIVLTDPDGEYTACADPDAKVTVQEQSPVRVVIKAAGAHRNAAGERRLDFVARIYAWAGSPVVRVTYTFVMAQGEKIDEFVDVKGLCVELPTAIKAGSAVFGAEDGPKSARLAGGADAFVLARDSDSIEFGGALTGSAKGKSARPRRFGWADLSDGKKGLAAGVRWFWQMHPRSVEASGDGTLRVGLYSSRAGTSEKIFVGVARTHYLQLVFHGAADATALAGQFAGLEEPLRPFAPCSWYCRRTESFGNVVEADPQLYRPEHRALVEKWDKAFEDNWKRFDKLMDGRNAGGGVDDDYGMLEWGDNFHYTKSAPWGKMHEWNSNYYGYPHMMALQFVRTGNPGYFDHFDAHALHVADVHTVHYDPKGKLTGGGRYCPPGEHVRMDEPEKGYPVYMSDTFNHYKVEGVVERWYFTGDHRMRDVMDEQGRFLREYKAADRAGGQPRGPGHQMISLAKFYEDSLDPVYLERCKTVFDANKKSQVTEKGGKANFQQGVQLEGARRYYEISGDEEVLEYFKRWAAFFEESGTLQTTAAQAFGLLHAKTGDAQYMELALKCIGGGKMSFSKEKDWALTMRNGPYFFYFLREPEK